jgi:stress response protein SCP2
MAYQYWAAYVFAPFAGALLGSLLFFLVQGGMYERFEYKQGSKPEAPPKEDTPPVSDDEETAPPAKLMRKGSIVVDTGEWIVLPDEVVNANFHCGVKWTMQKKSGKDEENIDMDLACVKFNKQGECQGAVYFAKKDDAKNKIFHSGDAIMGDEQGDNEFVTFKLKDVQPNVHMLAFVITIYSSDTCFGDLSYYHARLVSEQNHVEYCRHESSTMASGCNALIACVLYRKDDKWIFKAVDDCQKVPPHSSYRRLSFASSIEASHLKHDHPELTNDSVLRGTMSPPSSTRAGPTARSTASSVRAGRGAQQR